jgi:hypothetical protein
MMVRTRFPFPTAALCLPNQLRGASLLRCSMTVLLCNRLVMSYHADVMSLFSRRRASTSCCSSAYRASVGSSQTQQMIELCGSDIGWNVNLPSPSPRSLASSSRAVGGDYRSILFGLVGPAYTVSKPSQPSTSSRRERNQCMKEGSGSSRADKYTLQQPCAG